MSKAPLVHLEGKLGKFGHARTFKVDGLGHLTKSKGRFVLHAAITASQAARLDEASKKVSAEEEAQTRGHVPIGMDHVYQKGDSYMLPNMPGTKSQPIEIVRNDRPTTAGASYFAALQEKGGEEDRANATRALGARGGLVGVHLPKQPAIREGESEEDFARRQRRHGDASRRREAQGEAAMPARAPMKEDFINMQGALELGDGAMARQIADTRGKRHVILRLRNSGRIELVRFSQEQIREIEQSAGPEIIGAAPAAPAAPLPVPRGPPRALAPPGHGAPPHRLRGKGPLARSPR